MESLEDEVEAGAFAHGFVGANSPVRSQYARPWRRVRVGTIELAIHPRATVTNHDAPHGPSAALLGQAVDLAKPTTQQKAILRRLTGRVAKHGLDAGTRYAATLGGRWAALVTHAGTVHVLHDSHAAQSVYWAQTGRRLVLASHAALCADEVGAEVDHDTLSAFDKIREVRPKGTVFLPGARTPYKGVRPIIANCRLEFASGVAKHRRFGPLEPLRQAERRSEDVYSEFEFQFERHVGLLASFGPVGLSLTAGGDSAVTLSALSRIRPRQIFSYTYANPRELASNEAVAKDVFGASQRAFQAGLQHQVIRWRAHPSDDPFESIVARTWPLLRPSIGAAFAMYRDLPREFIELQSTISETGTAFYRNRDSVRPTAERLTSLWAGNSAATRKEYVEAFEEYIEYTQFTESSFQGYNYHDLFYWEHRNSRWAAEKYQVGDIGHRVLLPFNARAVIEPMLALPYSDRFDKWILAEYLARRGQRTQTPTGSIRHGMRRAGRQLFGG